jgi:hypothetical protein
VLRGIVGKRLNQVPGLVGRRRLIRRDLEGGAVSRTIKIKISGRGAENDAPTVEDVLDQIKDYVDILRGVEEAIAGEPSSALDWRIVDAHRNSPLEFDLQAFPKQHAVNIERRVALVTGETARGLAVLQSRAERPPHFTNPSYSSH